MSSKKTKGEMCEIRREKVTLDQVLLGLFKNEDEDLDFPRDSELMVACRTLERLGLAEIIRIGTLNHKTTITDYYVCTASAKLQKRYDQGLMAAQFEQP